MFEASARYARGDALEAAAANDGGYPTDTAGSPAANCGIVGRAPSLHQALLEVEQVAGTDATVLVTGESGTGKELIARAIHAASPRRGNRLVKVNCAALPANLIESELFGHERGAFTGATLKREGRFALADAGTLFLDEIGELPLELQAKLLRVLQEGQFEPLGSTRTRKVDVRVIAATNRDLAAEVRAGRFRGDLYYRLDVFPIHLPALRERSEDIPLLAEHFVSRCAERLGRTLGPISSECMRRLQQYAWPGNVRELQNVVERAAIASRDGRLDFRRALPNNEVSASVPSAASARVFTVKELEELERANLLLALQTTGWRVSGEAGAAQLLGINPSTLASRIRAFGLHRPRDLEAAVPLLRPNTLAPTEAHYA